jgi:hypothetical protein
MPPDSRGRIARAEIRAGLGASVTAPPTPAFARSIPATSTARVGRGRGRRGARVGPGGRSRWCDVGRAPLHRVDELGAVLTIDAAAVGSRTRVPHRHLVFLAVRSYSPA